MPRHLCIQADNTVSQAKKQWLCLWLGWLVHRGFFDSTTLNFLRVGHTHEDIDQFFSLIVALILRCHHYQEPTELLDFLVKELRPKFSSKHEELFTEVVTAIRDWNDWLLSLNRSVTKCFANRMADGVMGEAPHSFTMKQGGNLSESERAWLRGTGGPELGDVYITVKDYMASLELRQAPEVLLPRTRTTITPLPETVCERLPLGPNKIHEYTKLALKCRDYDLPRAANALETLMFDMSYKLLPLEWLEDPGTMRSGGGSLPRRPTGPLNKFFPHIPTAFDLVVKDRAEPSAKRRCKRQG